MLRAWPDHLSDSVHRARPGAQDLLTGKNKPKIKIRVGNIIWVGTLSNLQTAFAHHVASRIPCRLNGAQPGRIIAPDRMAAIAFSGPDDLLNGLVSGGTMQAILDLGSK